MTYPGPPPVNSRRKKTLAIVGGATAAWLLGWCGLCGVVSLATSGGDPEPGVSVSAEPAADDQVTPSPPQSPTPSASPTPSPAAATATPIPKPTTKRPPTPARTTKAPPPPPPPPDDEPDDVYYANCAEVRAAGAAPLYRGEPGYRKGLDRDGDGVACE